MINLCIVVLAWGFSWYAIRLQVGDVAPVVSIGWRFLIAGISLMLWLALHRKFILPARTSWLKVIALGTFLFGANFISFYYAAPHLASGLISLIFAMAVFIVALNEWLWKRKVPEPKTMIGAIFGVTGLALLFGPTAFSAKTSIAGASPALGVALSLLGTWFFSIGNLVSQSFPKQTHMPSMISCAMIWSATVCLLLGFVFEQSLALPNDTVYLVSLVYLALGASVVAFVCYISLVSNHGAAKASYATILFPIVALSVSTILEGYEWTAAGVAGAATALSGACIVFLPLQHWFTEGFKRPH